MNIAFLGLGAIGRPMAARVAAAGLPLTVWNRTASRAEEFAREHGARQAATPADAAREADVVITCLPTSRDVAGLLDGADGLMAGMHAGATLVDCTSGDPATSRVIHARLAASDIDFIDAPVSGGTSGAQKGTLTIMVGGDQAVLERVRPVLETFGQKIVHCGDVGAGDAVKAVNNALLATHILAAAEGLAALRTRSPMPSSKAARSLPSTTSRLRRSLRTSP